MLNKLLNSCRLYVGCAMFLNFQWLQPVAATSAPLQQSPSDTILDTQSGGLSDTIDVTFDSSVKAHDFAQGGTVTRTLVGDQVGDHNMRRLAHVVSGQSSWLSYRVKVQPEQPTTVEVEEMYGRDRDVHGYFMLADEGKVYLRTWQGCGAGPVHYFVQLPATNKQFVTLKMVNQLATPFSVSRIWAFSNFQRYFNDSQMAVPYYLAPTAWLGYTDYAADLAKLRQIKTSLGNHPHAKAAWTTWIPYANLNDRDVAMRIDYIFRLARDLDMPVQISFDTWWANTPGGADGKGGYWTDVEYQQVVYNASKRQFQLSVPNQWSNTPWLTVNNPDLNAFKAQRIRAAMSHLQKRYRELCAEGRQRLLLALNLDNEPVYWASGNAGLGSDLLFADFNAHTIEAAQRDGVTLDPTNGLSQQARLWLQHNLLNYNEMIGAAMANGLGRDATIINGDTVTAPNDLLRNNIYTQAMVANADIQYPMLDATHPFWETAAPNSVRVGGEWNGNSLPEIEAVTHQLALGRNAAVNAECGNNANAMQGVRPGYALAQRYFTLYNYPLDKMNVAASEIEHVTQPFPAFQYQPVLLEDRFRDNNWQKHIVDSGSLQSGVIGNTAAVAVYPTTNTEPGYLTYRLTAPQGVFDTGIYLEFQGRAFVFRKQDPNVYIRVLAGDKPDAATMQEVGRVFDNGDINAIHRINLSPVARGKSTIYVRLELNAPNLPKSVLSWCALYHVRFTTAWPQDSLQGLAPQDESLATVRTQNLVVSWRRDAELAIAALSKNVMAPAPANTEILRALKTAQTAYVQGSYAAAYEVANGAISIALPATFYVQQSGWLKPFPVHIEANHPVTCTITQYSQNHVELSNMQVEHPTPVTISVGHLSPGQGYIMAPSLNSWSVSKASPGQSGHRLKADAAGRILWATTLMPNDAPQPKVINGIYRSSVGSKALLVLSATASGNEEIAITEHTIIKRGEPGQESRAILAELQRGDQITALLGADGGATAVTATYHNLEGIVTEFGQLTPYSMPYVILNTDKQRHIIDLSGPLHLPQGDITIKAQPLGTVSITIGDKLKLRINPKTGRVFELWKPIAVTTP